MTKDDHTEPQRCRPDLFQETSLICRNPDLRLALQPALAALIERVMGAAQAGTGGDARLTADHLARSAMVCIHQSSAMQVRNDVERRKLQYALEDHARALGFAKIEVIDDDLGVSGSGVHRAGFERLLQAVCSGSMGLVLAIEASRPARNGRDWHALLEICAVVGCLVGDRHRIHDPAMVDDGAFLWILCQARHSG